MSLTLNHFAAKKMLRDLTDTSSGDGPDDIDLSSIGVVIRKYDVPGEQAKIAGTYVQPQIADMLSSQAREMAATAFKETQTSVNVMQIESDPDVGGRHKPFEVRIDMPTEQHKSFEEAGKSVADRINEGGLGSLISSFSGVTGPPWLRTAMYAARLVAYVSTSAAYGMRAYNEKLSRILSKVGALAVSALVIASLTMPLPFVWAWIVSLAAWLITAIAVLSN